MHMKQALQYLALTTATLLLASCGGGDSADKTAADSAAKPAETTAAAAPAPTASAAAPTADSTDTLDGTTLASLTGDAAHGKTIEAVKNMIGPSLAGVVGRKAGTEAGYSYSAANKGSGITWTAEKLFQYLEKPQRVVPGTKMSFAGLPKAQDRADVIAYLKAPN